jgi:subtilase family serine protease
MKHMVAIVTIVLFVAVGTWARGNEQHIMGTVTAMSPNSITVQTAAKVPQTITASVVPSTKFLRSDAAASLTDLKVGDRVVMYAKLNGDKVEAATVKFGKPPHRQMKPMSGNEQHIMGTATAMSPNSITVETAAKVPQTITASVVPSTKFLKSGTDASMTDLKVGDRVVIHAKLNGDKLEAATVKFGRPSKTGMTPMGGMSHQD